MLASLAFNGGSHDTLRDHGCLSTGIRLAAVTRALVCALIVLALSGCYKRSVLPQSEGHVTTPAAKVTLADVPPPTRVSTFLPPPKPTVKPPTYSVVVNEVPVKELLFALARD